jgi:hypothetical protein
MAAVAVDEGSGIESANDIGKTKVFRIRAAIQMRVVFIAMSVRCMS